MLRQRLLEISIFIVSVVASFLAVALLVKLTSKVDPTLVLRTMISGSLGSRLGIEETILRAIPLSLTALAVSLAARLRLVNIGAEGQWASAGFFATAAALYLVKGLPAPLAIIVFFAAGIIGGAVWGLIPALLKIKFEINEIISTLLLNYVAIIWVDYLYNNAWRNPKGFGFPGTAVFPETTYLPLISGRLHAGIIIPIVLVIAIVVFLYRTKYGLVARVVGASTKAARYFGFPVERYLVGALMVSGAVSGLGATIQLSGILHKLQTGFTSGYGFTGILVAFMGSINPVVVILAAFLMSVLSVGGDQVKISLGLPASISEFTQILLIVFLVLGRSYLPKRELPAGGH